MKQNKILKGLNNYKAHYRESPNKNFEDILKTIDNHCFFILICFLYIICSMYSIAIKKNISDWSTANWENTVLLENFRVPPINTMYDALNYTIGFVDVNNQFNVVGNNKEFMYYGTARLRFLRTQNFSCYENVVGSDIYLKIMDKNLFLCYHNNFNETTWDTTSILNYKFSYPNSTNISHYINTPIGHSLGAGINIDLYFKNQTDYTKKMKDLAYIANPANNLLPNSIKGIELSFNVYNPSLDVFISNLIIFERDINLNPLVTYADTVSFITNVYETSQGQIAMYCDLVRGGLFIILFLSLPLRIYQKYKKKSSRGILEILFTVYVTVFQIKNVLLLLSGIFLACSFINFFFAKIDTVAYFDSSYYIDVYDFAISQKNGRVLDIMSFYIITIYSLKYLQYVEKLQILFIALKKSAFEYFFLYITIGILFVGLSILTNFVFGTYIFEYQDFTNSILMNIKIFIFIENTSVTAQFMKYYRILSIVVIIIFIFLIRYFLLNLFYPIFIEYYRIENDKYSSSKSGNSKDDSYHIDYTFNQSNFLLIF
jgi:hypothetical protein